MSESMQSLYRRGAISGKQMGKMSGNKGYLGILNKTKHQKSKMAAFDGKGTKDQGQAHGRGIPEMSVDEIDERGVQDTGGSFGMRGKRGPPSPGGRAGGEKNPGRDGQINAAGTQKPKFPAGGNVKKNSRPVGRQGLGGTSPGLRSSGPPYGGPSSRKYG